MAAAAAAVLVVVVEVAAARIMVFDNKLQPLQLSSGDGIWSVATQRLLPVERKLSGTRARRLLE